MVIEEESNSTWLMETFYLFLYTPLLVKVYLKKKNTGVKPFYLQLVYEVK